MIAKVAAVLALFASTAVADQRVQLYNPGNTIILYLEENGWIMHHVGHGKQTGPVRCYSLDDKLTVDKGSGWDNLEGCFVEIDRNGALRSPAPTKKWSLRRMADMDGALEVDDRKTFAEVSIGGSPEPRSACTSAAPTSAATFAAEPRRPATAA